MKTLIQKQTGQLGSLSLQVLDKRIEDNGFLTRDSLAIADIAIFPFVRQFRIADPAWFDAQDVPALQAWLTARMEGALFNRVMIKQKRWTPGDADWVFKY